MIHGLTEEGGPTSGREAKTNWPFVFTSWIALVSEPSPAAGVLDWDSRGDSSWR